MTAEITKFNYIGLDINGVLDTCSTHKTYDKDKAKENFYTKIFNAMIYCFSYYI